MTTNDAGEVGMVYRKTIDKYVRVRKNEYVFRINKAISFAWVKPEDVADLLSIREHCNCSGGSSKPAFDYANDAQTRIWNGWAER